MLDHPLSDITVKLAVRHTAQRKSAAKRWRSGPVVQLVLVSAVVLASSIAIYPAIPRLYTSTADVLLHSTNQEGATTWNQSVQDALDDNAIQTKIDMLKSLPLQGVVIRTLNLMGDPEFNPALHPSWLREHAQDIPWLSDWLPIRRFDEGLVAAELVRHLVVLRERKSYLIQVGYSSSNPVKAAWMTDALTRAFFADQIDRKRVSHEQLLAALSNRVGNVEKKYHADEQIEQDFLISSGLINSAEKDSLTQQLQTLSTAAADNRRRALELTSRAKMLTEQSNKGLASTNDALSSPLLQRLRERLVELSTGAGTGSLPTGLTLSVVNALREGIDNETQHLVHAAQAESEVAQGVEVSMDQALAALDAKIVQWKTNQHRADELHRVVQMDLEAINSAYQRYMQEAGRGDVLQADVELVAPATTPDRSSFPDPIDYAAGTIALMCLLDGLVLMPMAMRRVKKHAV